MDTFNRISVSLVALLLLVGAVVILLVVTEAAAPDFLPGGDEVSWFEPQLEDLAEFGGRGAVTSVFVSIVVGLAMLGLVFIEIRPAFRRSRSIQVSATPDGFLTIDTASVRLLAERTGGGNRNITSLRCGIRLRRRGIAGGPATISISCYPRVLLGCNLQEVRDDLQIRVKQAVEQLTGLTVTRVNARVRYDKGDSPRLMDA